MHWSKIGVGVLAMALAGCSDEKEQPPVIANNIELVANGTVEPPNTAAAITNGAVLATGPGTAWGLTAQQIEDADLVDRQGREIGEVERTVTDSGGTVTGLVIEIDDTTPDRFVQIPSGVVEPIRSGDDWDLRTRMTRDQLLALPDVAF